jgi:hypothetical protein
MLGMREILDYIKKVNEEDIFKAPTPEDIDSRKDEYSVMKSKELYKKAESGIPGVVDKFRSELGKEELVQTAIAYADSYVVNKLLKKLYPTTDPHGGSSILNHDIRDLDWPGMYTDGQTFIEQCKIVSGYNNFDVDTAKFLVRFFTNKQFRLAREGSVAVYIRPISKEELDDDFWSDMKHEDSDLFDQDESSLEGDELRLWWD